MLIYGDNSYFEQGPIIPQGNAINHPKLLLHTYQRAKNKTTDNVKGSLKCATMLTLIAAGECVNSYDHFGNWHHYESSRTYIYHRTQISTSKVKPERNVCTCERKDVEQECS